MPEPFRLIKEEFSKVDQEWQWTYACSFSLIINHHKISKVTITDHSWQKKGREKITKELILTVLKEKLNGQQIKSTNYPHRKVFKRERIPYQNKKYKIVCWFENNDPHWIWIRNFHPQD